MANAPQLIEIAHWLRVFGRDSGPCLFTGDMRMRELADQVARDLSAEHPSRLAGAFLRERIKLRAGDVGARVIVTLDLLEDDRKIGNQPASGMMTEHIGSTNVGFPVFKDRAKVDIDDIVAIDRANRRIVGCNRQRIRTGTHDALVPVLLYAKPFQRDLVDILLDLLLATSGPQETFPFDGIERAERLSDSSFASGLFMTASENDAGIAPRCAARLQRQPLRGCH